MAYVDGFVVAVPKANIAAYKAMAQKAGAIWKEYGATSYVESVGDDVPYGEQTSFPRAVQARKTKWLSSLSSPIPPGPSATR